MSESIHTQKKNKKKKKKKESIHKTDHFQVLLDSTGVPDPNILTPDNLH